MHSILVVDDDRLIREILVDALTRTGYRVLQCDDGKDVMGILRNHPTDLLITDLFMENTDGLATISTVRKAFPNLKVVAISAGSSRIDQDYLPIAQKLGAHAAFHKPVNLDDLLVTVAQLLATTSRNPPEQQ